MEAKKKEDINNKKNEVLDNKKFDPEDRLVKFACLYLDVCDLLQCTKKGQNLEANKKVSESLNSF